MPGYSLYRSLIDQQVLAPYVQTIMMKHTWPDNLEIPNPHYHDSIRDDYFHPSTHALYGEKAIYTMLHPELRLLRKAKDERDYAGYLTPLFGTVYHLIIQNKLVLEKLVKPEDIEVKLVDESRHWRGHADLIFRGQLVDIKTINSRGYDNIIQPYNSWRYQLTPYMDALGLKSSLILLAEMGNPWRLKEMRIDFSQALLDEIYSKWERVQVALKNNETPVTCCLPENSRYCPIACGGKIPPNSL